MQLGRERDTYNTPLTTTNNLHSSFSARQFRLVVMKRLQSTATALALLSSTTEALNQPIVRPIQRTSRSVSCRVDVSMMHGKTAFSGDSEKFPLLFSDDDTKVTLLWKRHRRWSQAATKEKNATSFWRGVFFCLTTGGAFSSTLAAQLQTEDSRIAGLAGAVCLGLAPFVSINFLAPEKINKWMRCLATSESMKSEFYKFRASAGPYSIVSPKGASAPLSDDEKIENLLKEFITIGESVEDIKYLFAIEDADDELMPLELNRNDYIKQRLEGQYEFFREGAKQEARKGKLLMISQYSLTAIATFIGCLASTTGGISFTLSTGGDSDAISTGGVSDIIYTSPEFQNNLASMLPNNLGVWVPVLTTAGAALAAQDANQQPYQLASLYSSTARKLEDLVLELDEGDTYGTIEWSEFVEECEDIIEEATNQWMMTIKEYVRKKKKKSASSY